MIKSSAAPLAITIAIQSLVSMSALMVPVLGTAIAADTGLRVELIGVFIGGVYLSAMCSSLISGGLIGRAGPIRMSQWALLYCAIGLLVTLWGSLIAMAAGALLIGVGYGIVTPASSHILARTTPPERMGFVFSVKQTGVPLGMAMAGVIAPPLEQVFDWRIAIIAVSVASVLVALISQVLRKELDADRKFAQGPLLNFDRVVQPFRLIFGDRSLRDIALCSFVYGAAQLCVTTYLVLWLIEVYHQDLVQAGLIMTVAQVGGVVGRLLWGWVADRLRAPRKVLATLGLTVALCFFLFAAAGPNWPIALVVILVAISGATAIGWNGVYLAEVARLAPKGQASTVTGGTLFFTYFGVVAGPPLFAAILSMTGVFTLSFLIFGTAMLLAGASLALTGRNLLR